MGAAALAVGIPTIRVFFGQLHQMLFFLFEIPSSKSFHVSI